MFSKYIVALLLLGVASSCVPHEASLRPEKTQLEVREFQTRTFDIQDSKVVLKSVLNVLQDDGYMVKSAASDLGFLAATKDIGIHMPESHTMSGEIDFSVFRMSKIGRFGVKRKRLHRHSRREQTMPSHQLIEATVNVSEFGEKKVRVRANFQSKVYDTGEAVIGVKPISDEIFYQEFFAKVDKGIFLQQQNI